MDKNKFIELICNVTDALSVTGKRYYNICVKDGYLVGKGENRKEEFKICIESLYKAYCENYIINTDTFKNKKYRGLYYSRSPSLAILIKAGLVGEDKHRIDM